MKPPLRSRLACALALALAASAARAAPAPTPGLAGRGPQRRTMQAVQGSTSPAPQPGQAAQQPPGVQPAPPQASPLAQQPPRGASGPQQQPAPQQQTAPPGPPVDVGRFGRFDLDTPVAQLAKLPDLRSCAEALLAPAGRADCALPPSDDKLYRAQLAWEDGKPGGELVALRLLFDPATAPPLTDLEWQLTRGWGPPVLEQLRREAQQKVFTLQWEDAEHRTTLEAAGPHGQGSRVVALVIERKPHTLPGDLASLRPRPFPGLRLRFARRVEWDGQAHAVLWGTNLSPAQETLGDTGAAWAQQRGYVGIFRLEPAGEKHPRRWRPLWERVTGEDDDDPQRILRVDTRDVTSDGTPDVEVELSCATCGNTSSEVLVKTVRAGKLVDLLSRRDLYHAQVELSQGKVRIHEPEGDNSTTVTTYAYDRGKGAFVLAREERVAGAPPRP